MTTLLIKPINDNVKQLYINHKHYHEGDSGLDLYIPEDEEIICGQTKIIDLGIQCEMINNNSNLSYYLYARSSISKTPLIMANNQGIIDSGYRGNIKVALKYIPTTLDLLKITINNDGKSGLKLPTYKLKAGTRLVQICKANLEPFTYKLVEELSNTQRGDGGFGSTGK